MALDTELLCWVVSVRCSNRPTEALLLPSDRRFFPFKIPNTHHQLRHYISTADPDRIYVAVGRIIYAIHISARKREILTIVPFDPKCLTAGNGWIGVGGTESGDCAFIKLDAAFSLAADAAAVPGSPAGVDSPLPLDFDTSISRRTLPYPPNVSVRELGGSIVNSVTLHRLPANGDEFVDEDIAVLSNNDTTVSIFSLPRMEVVETIRHPVCMNFAIISPDSKLLAAVGDENRVYFYRAIASPDKVNAFPADGGKLLRDWTWPLLRSVELDSDPHYDDRCCFTIAFSPSSHLCAVASQAGVITVFSVKGIFSPDPDGRSGREDILCVFRSSRSCFDGGAIRCMSFSPGPWDLLVWVEDHGRFGIADVRQGFSRRQVITLDIDEPSLERVKTDNLDKPETDLDLDADSHRPESSANHSRLNDAEDALQRAIDSNRHRRRGGAADTDSQIMRDSLARDLTARERQIIDFLNTARWASSIEEGPQRLPHLISPLPYSASSTYQQRAASQFLGTSPPPPPPPPPPDHYITRNEPSRNSDRARTGAPRRRNSVILSQDSSSRPTVHTSSALIPHPGISLRWPYSPNQVPAPNDDPETLSMEDDFPRIPSPNEDGVQTGPSNSAHRGSRAPQPEDTSSSNSRPNTAQRQRLARSRSIPRRADRPTRAPGERLDPRNTMDSELRSTLAAERLRAQRQAAVEENQRLTEWEQQYRRVLELDNIRSSPRIRNFSGEIYGGRESGWGVGTAGVGWSDNGRTLYIGTVQGIFEYHINVPDRKTFPAFSCR
ncbi:hypothetical protein MGYG_08159 [Nannizzia gypsea CBS 118893]|uniref:DUF2415 domain-containing protein n=1 Tax=Arthroderma gypseum (strain ATCC MYA-4604 / CBS 118893) TaxID=535722 RepID=E4V573_ARTGP|nr:hypothetical protein MGYG_08159 [Nannizzia gypsea CBS 118893]EFR05147.1 hypothetical protein MGYG_08159 [Nannizzia gypsea CBS 118893]